MGVERLVLLLEALDLIPADIHNQVDIFVIAAGEGTLLKAFEVSETIRSQTGLRVLQNAGGGSFKGQIKKADKSGAMLALIIGEQELASGEVILKALKTDNKLEAIDLAAGTQIKLTTEALLVALKQLV